MSAQAYGDEQNTEQLLTCHAPPIIRIPRHMKPPIFVYYELSNYFQNHRRSVRKYPRLISCCITLCNCPYVRLAVM